jgi:hypothetical protein
MPRYEALRQSAQSSETNKDIPLSGFSELDISADADLQVRQGETFSINISGNSGNIDEISFHQDKQILSIARLDRQGICIFCLRSAGEAKIIITMPRLERISSHGYNSVKVAGFKQESLEAQIEDISRFSFSGELGNIKLIADGNPKITLSGKSKEAEFRLQGSSSLDASGLEVENCLIRAENHAQADINVTKTLDHLAEDRSVIRYKGAPLLKDGKESIITPQPENYADEENQPIDIKEEAGLIKTN